MVKRVIEHLKKYKHGAILGLIIGIILKYKALTALATFILTHKAAVLVALTPGLDDVFWQSVFWSANPLHLQPSEFYIYWGIGIILTITILVLLGSIIHKIIMGRRCI